MGFTGGVDVIAGREAEHHLGGQQGRVGVFAADGEAWSAYNWSGAEAAIGVPTRRCPCGEARVDDRAVRWLDGTDARPLVAQLPHAYHAFHEDAKPGDLGLQFPTRSSSSSDQFTTR